MAEIDYSYLCKTIANLAGFPVRVYEKGKLIFSHSILAFPVDPIKPYVDAILGNEKNVTYFITPSFDYYGIVKKGDTTLVLGPTRQAPASEQDLRNLAFECDVPRDDLQDFLTSMKSLVPMPLMGVMQILCTLNYVMSGEKLTISDLTTDADGIQELIAKMEQVKGFAHEGKDAIHNTLSLEEEMLSIVRKGDTAALREWIKNAPGIRGGTIARDQLRQMKNTFIVSVTLVSRASIRGGLDAEMAFTMSDAYIQQCELASRLEEIASLQSRMVLDYTENVERIRKGKNPSKLFIEVANYVQRHLSEPINVRALADSLYLSRTHLAARFKKESGMTLTEYILGEKLEEGKRLLRYSDKPLTNIATYLGFSSQSHFANAFKQKEGISPSDYRKKHHS